MTAPAGPSISSTDRGSGVAATKEIITPEGVPIPFSIAPAGDRAAAFLFDLMIIILVVIALSMAAFFANFASGLLGALFTLLLFLVYNFYFVFFEIRWQGRTPGKRRFGLRVIDARGGPLSADSVLVRNLTRDLEVLLPYVALVAPEQLWTGAPELVGLASGTWLFIFALMPLFNRHRLRVGDIIAGTLVVLSPRRMLLKDLAGGSRKREKTEGPGESPYSFTAEQLDEYGIYELQVLEELLRQRPPDRRGLRTVCNKIRRRIGWEGARERIDPEAFLRAFYTAQRARLEQKLLFGERRERKKEREKATKRKARRSPPPLPPSS